MNKETKGISKQLSPKEEAIMACFWQHGPLFVREILELLPEPKPHFNTVSTFVRGLEAKGWVGHEQIGNSYRYHALAEAGSTATIHSAASLTAFSAAHTSDSYRLLSTKRKSRPTSCAS